MWAALSDNAVARSLLQWLLDLDHIRLGRDAPLFLSFHGGLPMWFLVPLGVLVAFVIVLTYRGERRGVASRTFLCTIRLVLVTLVIIMLAQPVLTLQRERVEPSHVALLIDGSRSMTVRDVQASILRDEPTDRIITRINAVRRILSENQFETIRELARHNELEVYTFGHDAERQASIHAADNLDRIATVLDALNPDATSTNVPRAITQVLGHTERGRLSAIVIATDGRTTEPADMSAAVTAANARQVPIYTILSGSPNARRDAYIGSVTVLENVFLKDFAAAHVSIGASGLDGPTTLVARMIDQESNQIVATQTVSLNRDHDAKNLELSIKPDRVGRIEYRIEVVPLPGEIETDNNVAFVRINVFDERLHVLYVDEYPRYEYRYLKNTLLREPTIRSSCLLLSADPEFAQEGTDPIRRFPQSEQELNAYDVIVFGDVNPDGDWLSRPQMEMIRSFVGEHGGGFGMICGPRHAPHRFRGTPIETLLPVRIDPTFSGTYNTPLEAPLPVRLTEVGRHHRILRFTAHDDEVNVQDAGFPEFYWSARTLGPKPGAVVLAEIANPAMRDGALPLFVIGRYGAGRVFFSATDDTWRWRRGDGEWFFDTFWLQVCRSLMQPKSVGSDPRLRLTSDRPRYQFGDPVTITASVQDSEWLATLGRQLRAIVIDARDEPVQRVQLDRLSENTGRFEGAFIPRQAGGFTIVLEDIEPRPGYRKASTHIVVAHADQEFRRPEADLDALTNLATATGGAAWRLNEIKDGASAILDRSARIPDDLSEPLWDSKLFLIAFLALILAEWVTRKALGML